MSTDGKLTTYRIVRLYDRRTGKHVQARVDLWFDVDKLAQRMGARALENKSGQSKLSGITAEARRV